MARTFEKKTWYIDLRGLNLHELDPTTIDLSARKRKRFYSLICSILEAGAQPQLIDGGVDESVISNTIIQWSTREDHVVDRRTTYQRVSGHAMRGERTKGETRPVFGSNVLIELCSGLDR